MATAAVAETVDSHKPSVDFAVHSGEKEAPLITDKEPLSRVLGFAALCVAVSNLAASVDFFTKIGFTKLTEEEEEEEEEVEGRRRGVIITMRNGGGMELHLCMCDRGIEEGKNILMDLPETKYPGHTHVAFTVPHVESTRTYLTSVDIAISGERRPPNSRLFALFARDPDRTTFEFENNHSEGEECVVTRDMIGNPQCMDHVGIRVSDAPRAFAWYAETLGFVKNIATYEPKPEVLKNFAPWISRTISHPHCDINLIINNTEPAQPPPHHNILLQDGALR